MRIEVIYARPLTQDCVEVELDAGATVAQAVERSGLMEGMTAAERDAIALAVWGRVVDPSFVLEAGDRVELLRPLRADPKDVRRKRAGGGRGKPAR